MSERMIVEHCAPTLAGIKTGNLVSCPYESKDEIREDLRRMNAVLRSKGLRMIPLKYLSHRVLIYVYRPDMLSQDLADPESSRILREYGYKASGEAQCICTLIRHLGSEGSFPHEIGLFLGYPPEDVRGFIENHGENSKLTGVWKVYGDPKKSVALFQKYKCCTETYSKAGLGGAGLKTLAVRRRTR